MSTRYFYFWCERCPTRITVETDVPATSQYPDPEYTFSTDGVALFQAKPPTPTDDGLEVADRCPACGGQLCDLDDLILFGHVPVHDAEQHPAQHARFIASRCGVYPWGPR